jgi:hypothetical protein
LNNELSWEFSQDGEELVGQDQPLNNDFSWGVLKMVKSWWGKINP